MAKNCTQFIDKLLQIFLYYGFQIPENNAIQIKRVLNDSRSGNSRPQNILFAWQIIRLRNTVCIRDETETAKNKE